jgi:LAGLIDADG DNA endonuclease family
MQSTAFIYKYVLSFIIPNTRAIQRIGPHNKEIISVLVGALLGDAEAERNRNGGVRFRFKQSIVHQKN